MHASLLGFGFESCTLDNDLLGAINRSVRGVEVKPANLDIETIADVCLSGPEHYLGHDSTLARMQKDYLYPELGDRLPPAQWTQLGAEPVTTRAREKAEDVLATHFPDHISTELDQRLRASFDIRIPRSAMKK